MICRYIRRSRNASIHRAVVAAMVFLTSVVSADLVKAEVIEVAEWRISNAAAGMAYAPLHIDDGVNAADVPQIVFHALDRVHHHLSDEQTRIRVFGPHDLVLLNGFSPLSLDSRAGTWLALIEVKEDAALWLTIRPDYDGASVRCGVFRVPPHSLFGRLADTVARKVPGPWQPLDARLARFLRANADGMSGNVALN